MVLESSTCHRAVICTPFLLSFFFFVRITGLIFWGMLGWGTMVCGEAGFRWHRLPCPVPGGSELVHVLSKHPLVACAPWNVFLWPSNKLAWVLWELPALW